MEKNTLAIIVLNWNNAADTVECVDSLLVAIMPVDATIFIADNGSDDDSVARIISWLNRKEIYYSHFDAKNSSWIHPVTEKDNSRICLLENDENLGFAKGNNAAIRFALNQFPETFDRFLLLNNDTLVPENSIRVLIETANKHPEFQVWTPMICYAGEKDIVWNAGGYLTWWGERKYIGHKQLRSSLPESGVKQISFITGCALLMDKSLPEKGAFLNEDFFFGEEDYYFSKQMKHMHLKMGVAFESVIYHKISTSIKQVSPGSQLPLFFIHYLNRIVDMKKWMHPVTFVLWKPPFVLHAVFNVWWKRWYSFTSLWRFMKLLTKRSQNKERVTQQDFFGAKDLFVEN